ncbi:hypothetical protein ABT124_44460 [Streptomyces sp. NPDC001982]|uniref:hypothetical protein n=1 Tax=unclassified Streptomyces TaxID=2593676 RepID=UPI00332EB592
MAVMPLAERSPVVRYLGPDHEQAATDEQDLRPAVPSALMAFGGISPSLDSSRKPAAGRQNLPTSLGTRAVSAPRRTPRAAGAFP